MRLIVVVDIEGLLRVDLLAAPGESEEVHRFFQAARPLIEKFGAAVARLGGGAKSGKLYVSRASDASRS